MQQGEEKQIIPKKQSVVRAVLGQVATSDFWLSLGKAIVYTVLHGIVTGFAQALADHAKEKLAPHAKIVPPVSVGPSISDRWGSRPTYGGQPYPSDYRPPGSYPAVTPPSEAANPTFPGFR